MPTLTLSELRADLVTAIENAAPDARVLNHTPVSRSQDAVKAEVFKGGEVHAWWIDGLSSSIGRNVGGTVDFEAEARLIGVISLEIGQESDSQVVLEDEAHLVIAQIQSEITPLRDIRLVDRRPQRMFGRNVYKVELSALFWSLTC